MDALPALIAATVIVQGLEPLPQSWRPSLRAMEGRRRRRAAAKRRNEARDLARREADHDAAQAAREAEARLTCTDTMDLLICLGFGSDDRALVVQLVAAETHDLDEAIAVVWAMPGERWNAHGTTPRMRGRG